jgi:hypothetical protein
MTVYDNPRLKDKPTLNHFVKQKKASYVFRRKKLTPREIKCLTTVMLAR